MFQSIFTLLYTLIFLTGCTPQAGMPGSEENGFAVHYIDVGQADSALVLCGDQAMLIDGGNTEDSNVVVAYLKKQNVDHLDYVICTHAHEDHVGGLSGPLSVMPADEIYAPKTGASSKAYQNFLKKAEEQKKEIIHPKAGDKFTLGSSSVQILGPVNEDGADINNTSIVLKITYGDTAFLFTGDAEREEEQEILSCHYDLKADVLKVGHHGSKNSTTYPFLREVMPEYAVISVGRDNSYGHPTEEALSRLQDAGATILRTDLLGDIIITSDGHEVQTENVKTPSSSPTPVSKSQAEEYIGNKKSKLVHLPSCKSLPSEENRAIFQTPEEAYEQGYSPCGNCMQGF